MKQPWSKIAGMENVVLEAVRHKGEEYILIRCANKKILNDAVKRLPKVRWSQTHRAWYVPLTKGAYAGVVEALSAVAAIDSSPLRAYLEKRKAVERTLVQPTRKEPGARGATEGVRARSGKHSPAAGRLSAGNLESLGKAVELLTLKAYSVSTIRTYRAELMIFFQVLGGISAARLTTDEVKRYLVKCLKSGLTEHTVHSRINALKFYYEQVLRREKFFVEIPRPAKPAQLPKVLSETEITRLFNGIGNKKHKAILFTAYSAGLRVSEVVNLKLADVDSERMQLFIERAKGKKDRYVGLSVVLLDILRNYFLGCKPRPIKFVFEGQEGPGTPYSARTAQRVFQLAREKAGIRKEVSFHSLRHSFATHVLEKGIDIRYIKDILGHFNIRTTERYLHVRKEQLVQVPSPLDDIWKKGGLEW